MSSAELIDEEKPTDLSPTEEEIEKPATPAKEDANIAVKLLNFPMQRFKGPNVSASPNPQKQRELALVET